MCYNADYYRLSGKHMNDEVNISELIREGLAAESLEVLAVAARIAAGMGMSLYLVGGIIRDLLLVKKSYDLDIVVEGDAVSLANSFSEAVRGKVTTHQRFRTATVNWNGQRIDFATARSETYPRPGALPVIEPGLIDSDLARRDFTVNAIAADLSPESFGRFIDPFYGREDLKKRLIRVLHEKSFLDDPTRIWRAVRYEQRLGFEIEPATLEQLRRNIKALDTVSRDRIRHELELVLRENEPEKVLIRAGKLGMLENIHPMLTGDDWLAAVFRRVRKTCEPESPPVEQYLALLVYRLDNEDIKELSLDLNLRKQQSVTLNDLCLLKEKLEIIDDSPLQPSVTFLVLNGLSEVALTAVMIAEDSPAVRENIGLYLSEYRHVRTELTGNHLREMGFTSGTRIKAILDHLLHARIDGEVTSRQDEETLVKQFLPSRENPGLG